MDVSAAILAGGKNLRMGRKNKALLEIEGQTFLERTVSRLRPLFRQIMIIGQDRNGYSGLGLPVFPDLRPGEGSLGGLLTALRHSDARRTFCVACDMPFLQPAVVAYLLEEAAKGWDVVIPRLPEGLEPLCAVYSVNLAGRIEGLLDRGEKRIRTILEGSRTRYVDADELRPLDPRLLTFVNINTPDDLRRVTTVEEGARG
jgi:molybdopterin-guanine dinucleotide biosynthesis protein A